MQPASSKTGGGCTLSRPRNTEMMNRRNFLKAAGAACGANPLVWGAAAPRPNILVITTDQQFADAASFRIGTRYLRTPNMDSLAASGRVYTKAYCANPLCVPSRTSMYTGRYPTETGVMDNDDLTSVHVDARKSPLMGTIFRHAGYNTGYFGKWHLPFPEKDSGVHGFAALDSHVKDPVTAANAARFIQAKHDAPFLLVASFLNPHNICEWARGQKLPLGDIGQPPPPGLCPPLRPNHEPPGNEPDIVALMRRSYQGTPMFPVGNFDEKKWREYVWAYYRMIEKVDAEIGVVLGALRQSGLERNTLVVFTSDHGDCQGSHRWNQKTVLYEESVRVPFIIRYKGVVKPGTSTRLANTGVDLIPTLCDYAGVAVPENLPGLSLKDAANGRKDPREYVVVSNRMTQGAPVDGRVPTSTGRMLRSRRYKYCAYGEGKQRESLVDLEKDPGEMTNLAGDPQFQKTLDRHRAMLAEWCGKTRDSFRVPAM
jgi:arylsulfatase A-like enzyme